MPEARSSANPLMDRHRRHRRVSQSPAGTRSSSAPSMPSLKPSKATLSPSSPRCHCLSSLVTSWVLGLFEATAATTANTSPSRSSAASHVCMNLFDRAPHDLVGLEISSISTYIMWASARGTAPALNPLSSTYSLAPSQGLLTLRVAGLRSHRIDQHLGRRPRLETTTTPDPGITALP